MKKLLFLCFCVVPCACWAAANKIKMVTYFPVPYVAYSQINAKESLDIGLTDTCTMKLGCTDSPVTLNAGNVNLESGRLDLNGGRGILGGSITLGSGNGTGNMQFKNVRIQTGTMESVNAQEMNINTLKLFDKDFPSCKEKDSSGQMSWRSLKLKGATKEELYLACGGLGNSTVTEDDCDENPDQEKCCIGDEVWNGTYCETPQKPKKRCLTKRMFCDGVYKTKGRWDEEVWCPEDMLLHSKTPVCSLVLAGQQDLFVMPQYLPVELASDYDTITCQPGTECNTCILGKKYRDNSTVPHECCYGDVDTDQAAVSVNDLYLVSYSVCAEMDDCSAGNYDTSCSSWRNSYKKPNYFPGTYELVY